MGRLCEDGWFRAFLRSGPSSPLDTSVSWSSGTPQACRLLPSLGPSPLLAASVLLGASARSSEPGIQPRAAWPQVPLRSRRGHRPCARFLTPETIK